MIAQAILDFFRDVALNWIGGMNTLASGIDAPAAGAAVGGVAAQAGHVLGLFIDSSVWPILVGTWAVWIVVWLATALIAMIARRFTSS